MTFLGSVLLSVISNDEAESNKCHLEIDGSSPQIIAKNITRFLQ